MRLYKKLQLIIILLITNLSAAFANPAMLQSDNRIKTYVYNENEVFLLVIHYGFQSSIEFGLGEEIETLSVGDSYAWKITPVGRRMFIKPLEENIRTNMTIITNKRTYQFDVVSKVDEAKLDKDLAYVVRFYYPSQKNVQEELTNNIDNVE
ncbi:MAG: TrbG/VirB9 family P-type conjugative transfer protein [Alphaproteobacteria bacterium]